MSEIPKPVVITGASGGIGADLAVLFAEAKRDLILIARSRDKLEALARHLEDQYRVRVSVIAADLGRPEAPGQIVRQIESMGAAPEVLVNNAGLGVFGLFAETDGARELEMLQVNVMALTLLTKLILPGMVRRNSGKILNVASTAAFQPGPLMAVYYATKAYVLSFSEALANELAGTGVTVTTLCPGPTKTNFHIAANMELSKLAKGKIMDSMTAARAGFEALMKGKRVVIPGAMNKVLATAVRLAPRNLVTSVVRRIQEPVHE